MGNRLSTGLQPPLQPTVDLEVRPSLIEDARSLAPRLRQADLAEIQAHSGSDPRKSIEHGIRNSAPAMTVLHKGLPAMIFGVAPCGGSLEDTGHHEWPEGRPMIDGVIWLLGSDDLSIFSRQFLRHSRSWTADICTNYSCVGNIVDMRNYVHVRWLQWLGFKFMDRIRYGPENRFFLRFLKEV